MGFTRTGNIVEIDTNGKQFRVEPGPRKIVAVATPELLDDAVTAEHYAEGKIDAHGQEIVLDAEMTYLDWTGAHRGDEGSTVYYLYENRERVGAELEDTTETHIWGDVATFDTEEEAIAAALAAGE